MSSRQGTFLFGVLFLVSCLTSCLTLGVGPAPIELDAAHYWSLAQESASGDWLQLHNPIDCRTPVYPVVLGLFQHVFGTNALLAVVLWQHILVLLVNLLVAFIGWRITGSRLAAVACYAVSVCSLMRPWFANLICPETLFIFLFTATFAVLCAYHQRPGFWKSIAFAALLGLTILVRPVPKLLWIPLFGLFGLHCTRWLSTKRSPREIVRHALAAAVVLTLVLSPWMARNWALFGKPFVARLPPVNKWQVCFQGGSAARLPIPDTPAGRRLRDLLGTRNGDVSERHCAAVIAILERKGLANDEIDQLISEACFEAVGNRPGEFFGRTLKRFVNFWRCTPDGIPYYDFPHHSEFCGQKNWELAQVAGPYRTLLRNAPVHWLRWNECFTAICSAGTLLLILRRQTRPIGASLACIFLYFAAVTSAVEVENYKYRVILEPLMMIASVCGCLGNRDSRKTLREPSARRTELEDTVPYGIPIQRLESKAKDRGIVVTQEFEEEQDRHIPVAAECEQPFLVRDEQPDEHVDMVGKVP